MRLELKVLIGSVVASALIGIGVLIAGEFNETAIRILLTSLSVTGASILALACGATLSRTPVPWVPRFGLASSILGFGLLVLFIWTQPREEAAWKLTSTLIIVATTLAYAALLSLARLKPEHRWAQRLGYLAAGLLAAELIVLMWGEIDESFLWRLLGVLSILVAAFTVLVPVLQRAGRDEAAADGAARILFCPRCGAGMDETAGPAACEACGTRFRVTYESSSSSSSSSSS